MKSFVLLRNLLLLFAFLPMAVSAYNVEIDGIYYNLDNNTKMAVVTQAVNKYTGNSLYEGTIVIPEKIVYNSIVFDVVEIGQCAFYRSSITSIKIPNSVTKIGKLAFENCNGLESLTIPQSVMRIDSTAFMYCGGLTSIKVEDGNRFFDSRDNCNAITAVQRKISKVF